MERRTAGLELLTRIRETISLRRGGRVAEGAPLLREYGFKKPIEGSNPSLSAKYFRKVLK